MSGDNLQDQSDESMNQGLPETLSEPRRLLSLFSLGPGEAAWMPSELGAILAHELNATIRDALTSFDDPQDVTELSGEWSGSDATIRKLLTHPSPPTGLLERLKGVAKVESTTEGGELPKEVATVLYIASIVAAKRAGARDVTQLDDAALAERVQWACRRRWLDAELRELFERFIQPQADRSGD
jgi:hypothetical protein